MYGMGCTYVPKKPVTTKGRTWASARCKKHPRVNKICKKDIFTQERRVSTSVWCSVEGETTSLILISENPASYITHLRISACQTPDLEYTYKLRLMLASSR